MMSLIQWLNDLPVATGAAITIGGGVAIAVLGTLIVNFYVTPGQLVVNNIVGGFRYSFLSAVYAGYIGLLLFGVYQKYDDVRSDIIIEVNALTTLDRIANAYPKVTRDQIRKELRDYASAVATIEWPQMQARRLNFESSPALVGGRGGRHLDLDHLPLVLRQSEHLCAADHVDPGGDGDDVGVSGNFEA